MQIELVDRRRDAGFAYNAGKAATIGRVRLVLERELGDGMVDKVQEITFDADEIDVNRISIVIED